MTFGRWLAAVALIAAPGLAQAQEGSGCGGFRWSLDRDRAAFVRADKPSLPNGGALAYDVATTLRASAVLGRRVAEGPGARVEVDFTLRGPFHHPPPAKPGVYRVTISSEGWVDVLDGGAYLHPTAFTGAKECDGARKSVKFDLPARPLALQFSGVPREQISVIVSPDQ